MKLNIYAIYDTASALYLRPIFAQSDGQALRSFQDASVNAESEIGKHPEDYTLVRIGMWDDTTAKLTDEQNASLATGLECVAKARNVDKDNLELFDKSIPEDTHGKTHIVTRK